MPVTVMVKVPVVAVVEAENVRVDVPVPPEASVTVAGLKVAVVPVGGVDLDNVTVPANPFVDVNVIVDVAELPWRTVTELGEALMVKSDGAGAVTVNV